jgi:bile acid-coenzyme A ligase
VIGLVDEDWGKRIHAVVQLRDPSLRIPIQELDTHCRARLAAYKVPKSYEFVERFPRDDSGKIRRQALVSERESRGRV